MISNETDIGGSTVVRTVAGYDGLVGLMIRGAIAFIFSADNDTLKQYIKSRQANRPMQTTPGIKNQMLG